MRAGLNEKRNSLPIKVYKYPHKPLSLELPAFLFRMYTLHHQCNKRMSIECPALNKTSQCYIQSSSLLSHWVEPYGQQC